MYPHRIRLRGPWECEPLARFGIGPDGGIEVTTDRLPSPCRMKVPCRWTEGGLADFAGRVFFRRRFGYPGRLEATDRVWLTFAGVEGAVAVALNGRALGKWNGSHGPFEQEITADLRPRNELTAIVESTSTDGGLWGEVALEIRCTAFLRGVNFWTGPTESPKLHIEGEVVGACERPLDLYVLLDNTTVAYTTVQAAAGGEPFHLVVADTGDAGENACPREVRVELIDGASVWYRVEKQLVGRHEMAPPDDGRSEPGERRS